MSINSDIYRLKEAGQTTQYVQDYIKLHYGEALTKDAVKNRYARMRDKTRLEALPVAETHDFPELVELNLEGNIFIFGDLHLPFTKEGYVEYGTRLYDRWDCQHCFFIGDLFDQYAFSAWEKDPESWDGKTELEKSQKAFKKIKSYFPNAKLLEGNHDNRFIRTAVRNGVPKYLLRSYEEIYGIPETWQVAKSFLINDSILIEHGAASGDNATLERARDEAINVIQGHTHSYASIRYIKTDFRGQRWAMNVGCGVNDSHYSMAYAGNKKRKSTLGYGLIIDGDPIWLPFKDNGR